MRAAPRLGCRVWLAETKPYAADWRGRCAGSVGFWKVLAPVQKSCQCHRMSLRRLFVCCFSCAIKVSGSSRAASKIGYGRAGPHDRFSTLAMRTGGAQSSKDLRVTNFKPLGPAAGPPGHRAD